MTALVKEYCFGHQVVTSQVWRRIVTRRDSKVERDIFFKVRIRADKEERMERWKKGFVKDFFPPYFTTRI